MISYRVQQRGVLNVLQTYVFPIGVGLVWLVMSVGLLSGVIEDRDTTGRYVLGIGFGLAAMIVAPCLVAFGLNQWIFITETEVRWKSVKPFDKTIYWCTWEAVTDVKVWSDKPPSDPTARIARIAIHRPFVERTRYGTSPSSLTIDSSVAEIRQIMDFINRRIPGKVVWEVR